VAIHSLTQLAVRGQTDKGDQRALAAAVARFLTQHNNLLYRPPVRCPSTCRRGESCRAGADGRRTRGPVLGSGWAVLNAQSACSCSDNQAFSRFHAYSCEGADENSWQSRPRQQCVTHSQPPPCTRSVRSTHPAAGRERDSKKCRPRPGLCSEPSRCVLAFLLARLSSWDSRLLRRHAAHWGVGRGALVVVPKHGGPWTSPRATETLDIEAKDEI